MSIIKIKGLKLKTILGIHPWEDKPRDIIINMTIDYDTSKAEQSDNIEDTLNYENIRQDIIDYVSSRKTNLIENLASNIVNIIAKNYNVDKIELEVEKPFAMEGTDSASITKEYTKKY